MAHGIKSAILKWLRSVPSPIPLNQRLNFRHLKLVTAEELPAQLAIPCGQLFVDEDDKLKKLFQHEKSAINFGKWIAHQLNGDSQKPSFVNRIGITDDDPLDHNAQRKKRIKREEETSSDKQYYMILDIDKERLASEIIDKFFKPDRYRTSLLSCLDDNASKRYVIDFSSPNIAKPFHMGHFKSTMLGNHIAHLLDYFGHDVTKINYLGDWGTQFGILSHGFKNFGDKSELDKNPLRHLLDVYVRANSECEAKPAFREEAKKLFSRMELDKDEELLSEWRNFRELTIKELKKVYERINIHFDEYHGESMYSFQTDDLIKKMEAQNMIQRYDDGAVAAILPDGSSVPIFKKDGTGVYLTRDIAAAIDRKERYSFDKALYVVSQEQSKHFEQLRAIMKTMGHEWSDDLVHVRFGKVLGMSTRKGNVVLLEDIIEEAKQRSMEEIKSKHTRKTNDSELERTAEIQGISGLVVHDFLRPRVSNYEFKWEYALRQSGNTGPILQANHARLCNLEINCGIDSSVLHPSCLNMDAIDTIEGWRVLLQLARFDQILLNTFDEMDPHILVHYLFELCHRVNGAYKKLYIKDQSPDLAHTRLILYICARNVVRQGIQLLGLVPLTKT